MPAVDRVAFVVRAGEVFGMLGTAGAGKTTTSRLLLSLIRPTSGTVRVAGRPPGHPEGLARIGALIGPPGVLPVPVRPRQPAGAGPLRAYLMAAAVLGVVLLRRRDVA